MTHTPVDSQHTPITDALWSALMDACRESRVHPAEANPMFGLLSEFRRLECMSGELVDAMNEIIAINDEDQGTFRKRGGTRRGLSIVTAQAAIAKAEGK